MRHPLFSSLICYKIYCSIITIKEDKVLRNKQWVYDGLKHEIGREPRQNIWNELVDSQYVSQAQKDDDLREVIEHYRTQDKRYPPVRPRRTQKRKEYDELPDSRLEHLSEIMAWDAAGNPDVIDFRKVVLHDEFLSPDKIQEWIEEMERNERGDDTSRVRHEGQDEGLSYAWRDKQKQWQKASVPVTKGGVLEKLKGISDRLQSRHGWQKGQPVVFILTGLKPRLNIAHSTSYLHPFYPALNTVTITVSPHLSPKQVAGIYIRASSKLLNNVRRRNRAITKKHLELAVFYHKHKGMKGAEMMRIWNKEHEGREGYKPYSGLSHFDRDAKHAHDRLVGSVGKGGTA